MSFVLFSLAISVLLVLVIIKKPQNNSNNNLEQLIALISQQNKKRKNGENCVKNLLSSDKYQSFCKRDEIFYKQINHSSLYKKIQRETHENNLYVENITHINIEDVQHITKSAEEKINMQSEKFRYLNGKCIIETVASSFAHSVLTKDNFDMFKSFKDLSLIMKVYKKEAEMLSYLVIRELAKIYIKLMHDTEKIKKQIIRAGKYKVITGKVTPAKVYGIYMFNKSAIKLFYRYNLNIETATTSLINELDTICYKQKIIYKYIKLLSPQNIT